MIPLDLAGTTVLVTGASGGLGTAIVDRFLESGAAVVAHTRSPSAMTAGVLTDARSFTTVGNLEDQDFVADMFSPTTPYGPVDILINNAGSYPSEPLLDTSPSAFDQGDAFERGNHLRLPA